MTSLEPEFDAAVETVLRMSRCPPAEQGGARAPHAVSSFLTRSGRPAPATRLRPGKWSDARVASGTFPVGSGSRWTSHRFLFIPHRVMNRSRHHCALPFFFDAAHDSPRASLPMCQGSDTRPGTNPRPVARTCAGSRGSTTTFVPTTAMKRAPRTCPPSGRDGQESVRAGVNVTRVCQRGNRGCGKPCVYRRSAWKKTLFNRDSADCTIYAHGILHENRSVADLRANNPRVSGNTPFRAARTGSPLNHRFSKDNESESEPSGVAAAKAGGRCRRIPEGDAGGVGVRRSPFGHGGRPRLPGREQAGWAAAAPITIQELR